MLNYIKSECYRITHTKQLYLFTGILAALAALFNGTLVYFSNRYTNTAFSYSNLVSQPMLFSAVGVLLFYILYEDSAKNGNLKNTVASGISRPKIFAGTCVTSLAAATFAMIIILFVWILSAQTLLPHTGAVTFRDLIREALAIYLIAAASLISSIVCMELFRSSIVGILFWGVIWFAVPKVFLYLALKYDVFYPAAMWFPVNFFGINSMHVTMNECVTIWDTVPGTVRCICSGVIGILIFTAAGIITVRRKDLD